MAMNDNDVEVLHAYLDGELPVAECEGLWRRLAVERELMAELDRLRTDQAVRSMVWSGLEPDDHSVARVQARVMRAARREDILDRVNWVLRVATTVAACIVFGFTVGWLGRERYIPASPTLANLSQTAPIRATASEGPQMASSGKVPVYVYDGSGKLVPVGQFNSLDEANQFAREYNAHAAQSATPAGGDSPIVPAMDKF
jgi:anti-sigma factor RsiW